MFSILKIKIPKSPYNERITQAIYSSLFKLFTYHIILGMTLMATVSSQKKMFVSSSPIYPSKEMKSEEFPLLKAFTHLHQLNRRRKVCMSRKKASSLSTKTESLIKRKSRTLLTLSLMPHHLRRLKIASSNHR